MHHYYIMIFLSQKNNIMIFNLGHVWNAIVDPIMEKLFM